MQRELEKWTTLWRSARQRCKARIVQHNFAIPPEQPFGHLGARLEGSRYAMTQALNLRLGAAAGEDAAIVDCERLSAMIGKLRWFDSKYWHLAKQAVSLEALPLLARHTAAVIAASLGLSKKCIVLDLDNTLWGGVIGEDGLAGIKLGGSPAGEAHVAFQEHLLKLKDKGLLLAVCSKNNDADAKEPFLKHPEMRIKLDDIACFMANWETKPRNLRQIASTLNIGIDSLVFVDDNPAERTIVRQLVPEVEVITLPADPSGYIRALESCLLLETPSFTEEDRLRTAQYRGRAAIAELEASAASIEEFYRSLAMSAVVKPFDSIDLPRIAQLLGKTNQFNLTTRRHGVPQLQAFMANPDCVHLSLRLRDRFADHGLVSLAIALKRDDALDIETWLMSCRVIGRTVEAELLKHLCLHAQRLGCHKLTGTYIPTAKNGMVKDIYARFGFDKTGDDNGVTRWCYDLNAKGPIRNEFIRIEGESSSDNEAAT
jgi:FkbH-like protein